MESPGDGAFCLGKWARRGAWGNRRGNKRSAEGHGAQARTTPSVGWARNLCVALATVAIVVAGVTAARILTLPEVGSIRYPAGDPRSNLSALRASFRAIGFPDRVYVIRGGQPREAQTGRRPETSRVSRSGAVSPRPPYLYGSGGAPKVVTWAYISPALVT